MPKEEYILPGIKLIEDSFDKCSEVVEEALTMEGWSDGIAGGRVMPDVRSVKVLPIVAELVAPINWYLVSRSIFLHGKKYANEHGLDVGHMETPQILHYYSGEESKSFYKAHFDASPSNPRDFSAVLYLNTVDKGGETAFVNFNLSIKPTEGTLILFPANYVYLHEALHPVSNDKFAVVTWFRFAGFNKSNSQES